MKIERYEKFVVNCRGKKTAVIVPIKRFENMLEDMEDLAVIAERRNGKPISMNEMKRRLKRHGLL